MIFYFSGTGNSLWVARTLARLLDEPLLSVAEELKKEAGEHTYDLGAKERILLVFPVHSWGPAIPVMRLIRKLAFTRCHRPASTPEVYAVCTCGDECGYTARILQKALRKRGLLLAGCYSVQMPNNYVLMPGFSVDPEAVEKRKLQEAPARVGTIADCIRTQTLFSARPDTTPGKKSDEMPVADQTPEDVAAPRRDTEEKDVNLYHRGSLPFLKSYGIYPLFTNFAVGKNSFYATDACISCGLCEKICPTGTIRLSADGRPVWADTCVQCVACIHRCPVRAIEYGKATQKKGRYRHPDINQ